MIDGPQNDRAMMIEAVRATVTALERGHTVLVHCSAEASRSPAVAAAGLAVHRDNEYATVPTRVRDARDIHVYQAVRANAEWVAEILRGG